MWFNIAASNAYALETDITVAVDREYYEDIATSASESRDSVASKMTPEQIAEAQKLAREWKPKSAAP